ncbi:MAG: transcriptional repressor [Caldilineales bacterium]|nr:transcriptional repressor [Caldilineales bacterium]MCW5856825.1 transcriptional repressor [Caldilineales bacterium]
MHTTHDYAAHIRRQGYRLTPQRQMILDAVCEGGGHTTVDEIWARVQHKAPAINRSTVYRNLEFLQTLHLVVAAEIGGQTMYEIPHEYPHHHLICQVCGQVIEIGQDALGAAFATIEGQYGFQVGADHLVLKGLCIDCRSVGGQ